MIISYGILQSCANLGNHDCLVDIVNIRMLCYQLARNRRCVQFFKGYDSYIFKDCSIECESYLNSSGLGNRLTIFIENGLNIKLCAADNLVALSVKKFFAGILIHKYTTHYVVTGKKMLVGNRIFKRSGC